MGAVQEAAEVPDLGCQVALQVQQAVGAVQEAAEVPDLECQVALQVQQGRSAWAVAMGLAAMAWA